MNLRVATRPTICRLTGQSRHACPVVIARREESSFRRTKQRLRVKPESSFVSSETSPQQDHIIFNPPSSAPSVYHTPSKFLPKDDRRRDLFAAVAETTESSIPTRLPPAVRRQSKKQYHLQEADLEEIRRLRKEDPVKWSRDQLAKKFECSALFVGIVCEASKEHKDRQTRILEAVKSRWGRRRRSAREDRTRRRETWGRDE